MNNGLIVPKNKEIVLGAVPMKKVRKKLSWLHRQVTCRSRVLPDCIIIGAMKSGTSSLYNYMSQHPQIFSSLKKEIHFFDGGINPRIDSFMKGEMWYRAHFPLSRNMSDDAMTLEASPLYIFHPLAPKRIFNLVPKVKIIAVLRNPTERAISHYFHSKRDDQEPLSIYEALQEEEERLKPIIKAEDYKNKDFIYHSYKSRGIYHKQIEEYLKYFPRQQILVLSSEDLFGQPESVLERVFEFLNIDKKFKIKNLKPSNVAINRTKVNTSVYEYLDSYFMAHNQALYELIGESYKW